MSDIAFCLSVCVHHTHLDRHSVRLHYQITSINLSLNLFPRDSAHCVSAVGFVLPSCTLPLWLPPQAILVTVIFHE